jgi:hypothetical protein
VESYIVRIYRRETRDWPGLVGIVEEVGVEGRRAFSTLEELWAILTASRRESSGPRPRSAKPAPRAGGAAGRRPPGEEGWECR